VSPRTTLSSLCAVVMVCGLTIGSCSAAPSVTPTPPTRGQLTPLLDNTLSTPRLFTGTDGSAHLVYELMLTNAVPAPVTLNTVEVHVAGSGTTLARLTGDSLRAATSLATSPEVPSVEVPPAAVAFVWLDIPVPADRIPAAITHRIAIDPPRGVPLPAVDLAYTGAAVQVDRRPAVAIGQPLEGAGWAALGSCCDGPHRRALYPIDGRWYLAQRFAVDFNQLDSQNRPGTGDPTLPTSFPTFGQPVYAVADGTVVVAADGNPDLRVGEEREDPTPDNAGGNRVVIEMGDGRFAGYAHLQQSSLSVHQGERVERGHPIAKVGSSGTTGGPHLHFQMTDRPSVVLGDGMPYVFDTFGLTGQTPPLVEVLRYYDTLEPIPISTETTGPRHNQLPLGRDVVSFPAIDGHG
jgi:murein DD-endopeptidase MepM/ murein hydrolase activator NlpD